MRKVTTINLASNAYQIDDDGFEALRAYLDSAEQALADNPDREEILADLEQAIADKCRLALGPHKTVVSLAEIGQILQEMGPVVGSAEGAGAQAREPSGFDAPSGYSGGFRPRRLYRISEGAKWAGLCQGLAAYAGIDVSLVRLAVIVIAVCTVFFPAVFIYVVMSFVVPAATTPEQISAAHGQPFRAQELVDRLKKKHDDFRSHRREKRRVRTAPMWSGPVSQPPPGYAARLTGGVLLPLLTALSAVWFSAMAIAAFVMWQNWHQGLAWAPGSWQGYPDFPRWAALVAIIAVYALFAIPLGAGRRAALYYANGGRLHGWADAWSGMLWIALVALILLGAWYLLPELQTLLGYPLHGPQVLNL